MYHILFTNHDLTDKIRKNPAKFFVVGNNHVFPLTWSFAIA